MFFLSVPQDNQGSTSLAHPNRGSEAIVGCAEGSVRQSPLLAEPLVTETIRLANTSISVVAGCIVLAYESVRRCYKDMRNITSTLRSRDHG